MNVNSSTALAELLRRLSLYDPADLAAIVAGLMLIPENTPCHFRLEVFANVVACLQPGDGKKRIRLNTLRGICNDRPLGRDGCAAYEDPVEAAFTESVTFIGGSYTVFTGSNPDGGYIARALASALMVDRAADSHMAFALRSRQLLTATLALGNEVATRLSIARNITPSVSTRSDVFVPPEKDLEILKAATRFSNAEITTLLGRVGVEPTVLSCLSSGLGQCRLQQIEDMDSMPLYVKPLLRIDDGIIVSLPAFLLTSTINEIVRLADQCGVSAEFASAYNEVVHSDVMQALVRLGGVQMPMIEVGQNLDLPSASEALVSFDSDKVAYVITITDLLEQYVPTRPLGRWELGELLERLGQRLNSVGHHLCAWANIVKEVAFVVVMQSTGRQPGPLSPPKLEADPVLMYGISSAALECISYLPDIDLADLWKFERAVDRFTKRCRFVALGYLNAFSYYLQHQHSFYTDDPPTDFFVVPVGGALDIRRQFLSRWDPHGVRANRTGTFVDVVRRNPGLDVPLYVPRRLVPGLATMAVECCACTIWIISDLSTTRDEVGRAISAQIVEGVAYWIWQLHEYVDAVLREAGIEKHDVVIARIRTTCLSGGKVDALNERPVVRAVVDPALRAIDFSVTVRPETFAGSDNSAELALALEVCKGFAALFADGPIGKEVDNRLALQINDIAPVGPQRMILHLVGKRHVDLDPRGIPEARLLQSADLEECLDDLGDYLLSHEQYAPGPISKDQSDELLKESVGFLYHELCFAVRTLSSQGLLESLITRHEAILHESATRSFGSAARIACFGESVKEDILRKGNDLTKAAIAARFVIEYVAAQPPSGLRPLSKVVYDRIQALAFKIFHFGYESDLNHNELATFSFWMLESGRLGVDRTHFDAASDDFFVPQMRAELDRNVANVDRYWEEPHRSRPSQDLVKWNAAFEAEFDMSFEEFPLFFGEGINIAQKAGGGCAVMPRVDLIAALSASLGWDRSRISRIIDHFVLRPRGAFLQPEPPHRSDDTWPWRFNRGLSYLRRPFILDSLSPDEQVRWGPRHLCASGENLLGLILAGRLKSRSVQMGKLMGQINQQRGRDFNDRVASALARNANLRVEPNVKVIKTPTKRIQLPGDVDVLVFDYGRKLVTVIECKELALARTAHELSTEIQALWRRSDGAKTAFSQVQTKCKFVGEHLVEVLQWAGISDLDGWTVEPSIVVDREKFSTYLVSPPVRIMSVEKLESF